VATEQHSVALRAVEGDVAARVAGHFQHRERLPAPFHYVALADAAGGMRNALVARRDHLQARPARKEGRYSANVVVVVVGQQYRVGTQAGFGGGEYRRGVARVDHQRLPGGAEHPDVVVVECGQRMQLHGASWSASGAVWPFAAGGAESGGPFPGAASTRPCPSCFPNVKAARLPPPAHWAGSTVTQGKHCCAARRRRLAASWRAARPCPGRGSEFPAQPHPPHGAAWYCGRWEMNGMARSAAGCRCPWPVNPLAPCCCSTSLMTASRARSCWR